MKVEINLSIIHIDTKSIYTFYNKIYKLNRYLHKYAHLISANVHRVFFLHMLISLKFKVIY